MVTSCRRCFDSHYVTIVISSLLTSYTNRTLIHIFRSERDGVGFNAPLSRIGRVRCRHSAFRRRIPVGEVITGLRYIRVSRSSNRSFKLHLTARVCSTGDVTTVCIPCKRVRVTIIIISNNQRTVCQDSLGLCARSGKSGVVLDCRSYARCSSTSQVLTVCFHLCVVVIRDILLVVFNYIRSIRIRIPLGSKAQVIIRHCCRNVIVPSGKCITCASCCRLNNSRTISHCTGSTTGQGTAICIPCQTVRMSRPLCIKRYSCGYRSIEVPFILAPRLCVPATEVIARCRRICRTRSLLTFIYTLRLRSRAKIINIKANGITCSCIELRRISSRLLNSSNDRRPTCECIYIVRTRLMDWSCAAISRSSLIAQCIALNRNVVGHKGYRISTTVIVVLHYCRITLSVTVSQCYRLRCRSQETGVIVACNFNGCTALTITCN